MKKIFVPIGHAYHAETSGEIYLVKNQSLQTLPHVFVLYKIEYKPTVLDKILDYFKKL